MTRLYGPRAFITLSSSCTEERNGAVTDCSGCPAFVRLDGGSVTRGADGD